MQWHVFPYNPYGCAAHAQTNKDLWMDTLKLSLTFGRVSFEDCGALLKSGARGMGRGKGDILLEPGRALEESSVFVCFSVTDLLVHSVVPSQLELLYNQSPEKILIDKNSGA